MWASLIITAVLVIFHALYDNNFWFFIDNEYMKEDMTVDDWAVVLAAHVKEDLGTTNPEDSPFEVDSVRNRLSTNSNGETFYGTTLIRESPCRFTLVFQICDLLKFLN